VPVLSASAPSDVLSGITKTSAALQGYVAISKSIKYAGTWGPGHNKSGWIHVKDVAKALLAIFDAALRGEADLGAEGHCTLDSSLFLNRGSVSFLRACRFHWDRWPIRTCT